jgi:hypothetical protein
VHGSVFYSTENIPYREGLVDSFGFVLWAESVQPAAGRFSINIEPPKGYSTPAIVDNDPTRRNDSDKDVNRSEVVEPDVKSDFVIVLAILIPLFVLLVIVVLVIYFLWRRNNIKSFPVEVLYEREVALMQLVQILKA